MDLSARPTKAIVVGVGPYAGIGAALRRRLAAEGHHVLVASRTAERIEAMVDACRQLHAQSRTAWTFELVRRPANESF